MLVASILETQACLHLLNKSCLPHTWLDYAIGMEIVQAGSANCTILKVKDVVRPEI